MRRTLANGCLVLLMIPAALLAYFWFTVWHTGHENDRRRQDALDSLLGQAHEAADRTTDALTRSGDTGTDALTGVVWKHTHSPVITYDEERRTFTAVAARAAMVEQESILLAVGPDMVKHCFTYTYVRRPGPGWTSKVTEQDAEVCGGSSWIGDRARIAQEEMEGMEEREAARLTRAGLQQALDPAARPGGEKWADVRSVVREERTVVAVVLLRYPDQYRSPSSPPSRSQGDGAAPVEQCYRLTRFLGLQGVGKPVTAVPVTAC
ncbi:hypothetical protein [Streptomyces sp. NRRL S-37]|uniref:hypothetical protein n=1 Tax=Streptomyces sp. NRRL S-37 TaxID=1463903 RepID=UPI0004C4DB41|nr:hypothetical protein [Streptomyces sp. NRRL S-37]